MIPLEKRSLSLLVTGGAGFIGSHLVEWLVTAGHRVTVIDDCSTGHFEWLPQNVTCVAGSVADPAVYRSLPKEFDGVFHLSGVVGMRLAVDKQQKAYSVFVKGTELLIDAIDAPIVLFGSSAVYGLAGNGSGSEEEEVEESSALLYDGGRPGYALGKLHAEWIARRRCPGRILIVRPYNVVGARQTSTYGMVLPSFLAAARAGQALTVYDDGRQTRCFCDVHTFVDTVLRLAQSSLAWSLPIPAVNIGNNHETEVLELAKLVLEVTGNRSTIRFQPYSEIFKGRTDLRSRKPDVRRLHSLICRPDWLPIKRIVADLAAPVRGGFSQGMEST